MPGSRLRLARGLAYLAFFSAVLWIGVFGAETSLRFVWPGYFLLGLAGLLGLAWWNDQSVRPSRFFTGAVLAFLAYLVARALASPVDYLARSDLAIALAAVVAIAAGTGYWARRDRAALVFAAMGLLLAGNLAFALIQVREWPELHVLGFLGYIRPEGFAPAGGFYKNGNHLAGFLEVVGLLFLGFGLFGRPSVTGRLVLLFGALVSGLCLSVTASRGGVVGFAGGAVAILLVGAWTTWVRGGVKVWTAIGATVALAATGALVFYINQLSITDEFGNRLFDQSSFRIAMFRMALQQHELSPVWGTGAGTFEYLCRLFIPPTHGFLVAAGLPEPTFAHCDYLELLAESGWVGLGLAGAAAAAAAWAALGFFWRVRRNTFRNGLSGGRSQLGVVVGATGVATAYALHSAVDFNLQIAANAFLFALACSGFNRVAPAPDGAPPPGGGRWWKALLLAGALAGAALVALAARYAPSEYETMRGEVAEHQGNPLAAAPHFRRAAELDPGSFPPLMGLGHAYDWLAGEEPSAPLARWYRLRAVEAYHQAKQVYPENIYAHYALALTLEELGAYEGARSAYEEALSKGPHHRDIWDDYAGCLLKLRDYEGARGAYQNVVDLHLYDDRRPRIWEVIRKLDELLAEPKPEAGTGTGTGTGPGTGTGTGTGTGAP